MFSFWHLVPIGSCLIGGLLVMYAVYRCIINADQDETDESWSAKPYILLLIGGLLLASAPPLLWLPVLYAG